VEAGSFYVMDRGYLDFRRFFAMHQAGAFFVTRARSAMDARRVPGIYGMAGHAKSPALKIDTGELFAGCEKLDLVFIFNGRGGQIRTDDPLLPKRDGASVLIAGWTFSELRY
jgi:hypothetical protein